MKRNVPPVLIAVLLVCVALLPVVQAVVPPPDGGYPGFNTAEGQNALFSLATGSANTAVGWYSLFSNTEGSFNTAVGAGALVFNVGDQPFQGTQNTAVGAGALLNNIHGSNNTANGAFALYYNLWGYSNTAIGADALRANTGIGNTAIGVDSLSFNTEGLGNTAIGMEALTNSTTGSFNIAIGDGAGANVHTAENVTCIGADGEDVSNTTWIGNVYGVIPQSPAPVPVLMTADNQLVMAVSSQRFVQDITPVVEDASTLLKLQPVNFQYIGVPAIVPEYGLIAEDVAKVDSNLVLYDNSGHPSMVRYDAVNIILLNAFNQQQQAVQEQADRIARLEKQIEALTEGLQKVSSQR